MSKDLLSEFKNNEDVLVSCKIDDIVTFLLESRVIYNVDPWRERNIITISNKLSKYEKDISLFSKIKNLRASLMIVFSGQDDYTKEFLQLIMELKKELSLYRNVIDIKILLL